MGKWRSDGVRRWGVAIAGAVLLHALLAVGVGLYVESVAEPTVTAELDLSSVELSFADEKAETAQVAPTPSPAAMHEVPPPQTMEPPPEVHREKLLPSDPSGYKFPEPKEEPRQVLTPKDMRHQTLDNKSEASDVRPETSDITPKASVLAQARVDAPPRPKRTIQPKYPRGARLRGEQGNVVLEVEVGVEGTCTAVRVAESSGFAELDEAAVKAARSARFTPAKSGDRAVASTARLTLSFRLK